MGGGGGSQKSTTTTQIDPNILPYVTYGLEEAKRLYQSGTPSFYPGKTYVEPSQQTLDALQLAETRALTGSPLVKSAQDVTAAQMGYRSPYESRFTEAAGAGTAPTSEFYRTMMESQPESEAMALARKTASGAYLEGNPFLQGALSRANRLATESYQEGLRGLQSQASAAGRYGSGAASQQIQKGQDVFSRALTEQNQQAYLQNYLQERANQEAAIGRLGGLEQQAIANRFAGAGGMQQDLATRLGALGSAQAVSAQDLERQRIAAGAAPAMAELDFSGINRLLNIGKTREGFSANELQDAINRFNFEQNLPQVKLSQFANLFSSVPQGSTVTQTATPQGGK